MGLFPNEQIEVRAYVDHAFVEIYLNQGRAVFSGFSAHSDDLGVATFSAAGGAVALQGFVVYPLDHAWRNNTAQRTA
jgi:sucrose-6-phosphate hydrolase SacC (GH32 family)